MDIKSRLSNPWFWVGLLGVILTATGADLHTLTTWSAVGHLIVNTLLNPVVLGGVVLAVLGVFVDPSTKGLSDKTGGE